MMADTIKLNTDDQEGFVLVDKDRKKSISEDELSKNANGGTEMMKRGLYERLADDIKDEVQIICSRVREVDTHRPVILWNHDLLGDPEVEHLKDAEKRKRFAKQVFVSHWQFTTMHLGLGVPYDESIVLKNAIVPIEKHKKPDDKINLIYHTTPHRGLEILVPCFEALAQTHKNIHLDVYSSFNAYGWGQRDEPYKDLFKKIEDHPQMTYHGYQPNEVVREALKKAHIFAYPNIWQETSCIAAMEAMSAGCIIIAPEFAALPETLANFGFTYQWKQDNNEHARTFVNVLDNIITGMPQHKDFLDGRCLFQKMYADEHYSWDGRIPQWDALIRSLITRKS